MTKRKGKKNQKPVRFRRLLGPTKKDISRNWNPFQCEAYRRINFSRWDVKWRLERIKNGVWKQTANDNTTNNIKFYKYIRNKTAAKGSVNRPDKQCTKEIFKKDKEIAGKLNNVFASVFTLENQEIEEKGEKKPYYVKGRPSSYWDIKKNRESMKRWKKVLPCTSQHRGHSPENPEAWNACNLWFHTALSFAT